MNSDLMLPTFVRDLLDDLHTRFGLDGWVLTRTVETDSMIIFATGEPGLPEGATTAYAGSLEASLVDHGPLVLGDVAASPHADATTIMRGARAFAGVPLHTADGALFGSLYGIGAGPASLDDDEVRRALSVASRALRAVLALEESRAAATTGGPVGRADIRRDPLTGLLNARGWEDALRTEDERCRRYGNRGSVVRLIVRGLVDAPPELDDGPGDTIIRQAGDALRDWRRGADVVARITGGLFGVLLVEAWEADAGAAVKRLEQTLAARRIEASVGLADNQGRSLVEAVEVAQARADTGI